MRVHDEKGGQIGRISDFILNPATEQITAVEISRGYLQDFINGRLHIPLSELSFEDSLHASIQPKGGEKTCFAQFAGELKSGL